MRRHSAVGAIVLLVSALAGGACDGGAVSDEPKQPANPFKEGTGWFYHYVRADSFSYGGRHFDYPATQYADVAADIRDGFYTDRGVSNIMIYGPYRASADFRGLPAIDYFDAQVGTGTVQDFRDMVATAHAEGITVTIYLAFLSVHPTNEIFLKAEKDRRDGIDSAEANMFRWAEQKPSPSENPSDFPEFEGGWTFSETAGQWYVTSWGNPALDYANQVTRDYVKDVVRFWLDAGVDGIEYDFPLSMLGLPTRDMTLANPNMMDMLIEPTADAAKSLWLHAEGAGQFWDEGWNDDVGFNHILINGDEDLWSFPYAVMDDGASEPRKTVDELEAQWAEFFDRRRERNPDLGVNAWSLYVYDMTPEQRALDAAVQAGMGALYSIDVETIYAELSADEQDKYDDVFRAVKRSPALAPGASRVRRPAEICGGGPADQVYAVERTSADGSRTVLNVYNFTNAPQCISVDLSGSGIAVPQTPVDLSTQRGGPPISSTQYDIELAPFGYAFLDVATG